MGIESEVFKGLSCYYGDIHNHCNASYGHGSPEDAFANARLQLDFASVTGHSSWPDMPKREGYMRSVVDYHTAGFKRLAEGWERFLELTERWNRPGDFVTFLSYEIHSMADGDHTALYRDPPGPMYKPATIAEFQARVVADRRCGRPSMLIPHHIAYRTGFRGINWPGFSEEASPLVEIVSMHGCSESDDAPMNYLHTMGPRNSANTMQAGLARGLHFGVCGSTDHHSAHPGSYGFGRTGAWAAGLTRADIWEALENRRTFAVTGDRMIMAFAVDGRPMGVRARLARRRRIEFRVVGGYAVDRIEILKNNRVLRRLDVAPAEPGADGKLKGKVHVEVGWGEKGVRQDWDVSLCMRGGKILDVEPRFHGVDIVDPKDSNDRDYRFTSLERDGRMVRFTTSTWGNPTVNSHAAQGVSLEIEGARDAVLDAEINGKKMSVRLPRLLEGAETEYLGGFLSGAVCFHRFVPEPEYAVEICFDDDAAGPLDFYYARVAQKNGQWGWTSPVRSET